MKIRRKKEPPFDTPPLFPKSYKGGTYDAKTVAAVKALFIKASNLSRANRIFPTPKAPPENWCQLKISSFLFLPSQPLMILLRKDADISSIRSSLILAFHHSDTTLDLTGLIESSIRKVHERLAHVRPGREVNITSRGPSVLPSDGPSSYILVPSVRMGKSFPYILPTNNQRNLFCSGESNLFKFDKRRALRRRGKSHSFSGLAAEAWELGIAQNRIDLFLQVDDGTLGDDWNECVAAFCTCLEDVGAYPYLLPFNLSQLDKSKVTPDGLSDFIAKGGDLIRESWLLSESASGLMEQPMSRRRI